MGISSSTGPTCTARGTRNQEEAGTGAAGHGPPLPAAPTTLASAHLSIYKAQANTPTLGPCSTQGHLPSAPRRAPPPPGLEQVWAHTLCVQGPVLWTETGREHMDKNPP